MTPELRRIRSRIAGNACVVKHGAVETARPMFEAAQTALNSRLIEQHQLDPSASDFDARLKKARSVYYGQLALKSAKTRARKAAR